MPIDEPKEPKVSTKVPSFFGGLRKDPNAQPRPWWEANLGAPQTGPATPALPQTQPTNQALYHPGPKDPAPIAPAPVPPGLGNLVTAPRILIGPGIFAPIPDPRWDRITMRDGVWTRGLYGSPSAIGNLREDKLIQVAPGVYSMVNELQLHARILAQTAAIIPELPTPSDGGGGFGFGRGGGGGGGGGGRSGNGFAIGLVNWRV